MLSCLTVLFTARLHDYYIIMVGSSSPKLYRLIICLKDIRYIAYGDKGI